MPKTFDPFHFISFLASSLVNLQTTRPKCVIWVTIVVSRDYLFMSWLANHHALLSHTPCCFTFPFVQTHVYLVWLLGFPLAPVHFCFYMYDFLLIPEQFYAVQVITLAKCMSFLTLAKCRDIRQILIGNIGWNIAQTCCFRHDA